MATARTKPSLLLKDDPSQLIDEWHVTQVIWNAVRHDVDERREKGQFILTGSTVIDDDEIMHTGIGRITKMAISQALGGRLSDYHDRSGLEADAATGTLKERNIGC